MKARKPFLRHMALKCSIATCLDAFEVENIQVFHQCSSISCSALFNVEMLATWCKQEEVRKQCATKRDFRNEEYRIHLTLFAFLCICCLS